MKTITIKILLIIAGLLALFCTPVSMFYSYLLFGSFYAQVDASIISHLYILPIAIICALGLFGVPASGVVLIIYGACYRGKVCYRGNV